MTLRHIYPISIVDLKPTARLTLSLGTASVKQTGFLRGLSKRGPRCLDVAPVFEGGQAGLPRLTTLSSTFDGPSVDKKVDRLPYVNHAVNDIADQNLHWNVELRFHSLIPHLRGRCQDVRFGGCVRKGPLGSHRSEVTSSSGKKRLVRQPLFRPGASGPFVTSQAVPRFARFAKPNANGFVKAFGAHRKNSATVPPPPLTLRDETGCLGRVEKRP
ncbi:hypothetical protein [Nitrosomonas communis]|uniref:hypothetical protein n=1 Tax=Nitrosomonas communis TaxID=44574 RepID=UPI003D2AF4E8